MVWTTPLTAVDNVALTAAQWNASVRDNLNFLKNGTIAVVKSANESVTSSTTLQDDNDFTVQVAANTTYEVNCYLKYDGPTAADLKFLWIVPASATFDYGALKLQTGATDATSVALEAGSDGGVTVIGTIGSGTNAACQLAGTLIVAGTSGTFKLQWAQNTSDASPSRIFARSHLKLVQIS